MRQMTEEFEEKPIEKDEDNKLDLLSMSRKERRKYKKQRLQETISDMSPGERRSYLLYYYKERIIISIIAIIAIAILGVSYYKHSRPISLSYVVINCGDQLRFNADAMDQYAKDIGKFDGYQLKGDTNVEAVQSEYSKDYEQNAKSQKYISFTTLATADYYDVIFTNMEGGIYCGMMDIFYPLDKYLDEETYNMVKDDIVVINNMDGKPAQYMIDVSDNEFVKSLNLGYSDMYSGFAGDQKDNHERVKEFLDYIYK